ncbi:HYC_CC_PP family protein [Arenibacter lacus]|uniref:HYC_CC_PP family protein n=1 Tax=Arenibacter lacus TaxID=2608629 RepID=UPI00123D64E9|nr:hypothetical protein [Arenibacter lacus]
MKSFLHKLTAACMAFLVLFTTMSFTVDMHYCGDTLVDYSLFHNVQTCGMEELPSDSCDLDYQQTSCCTDKQLLVEGQDDIKTPFQKLTFGQQTFVATLYYTYINLFEGLDSNIIPFRDYKPPFLIWDLQKLQETYII